MSNVYWAFTTITFTLCNSQTPLGKFAAAPHSPTPWNQWMLLYFGPTPAHEEASNFCLAGSQMTIDMPMLYLFEVFSWWWLSCFRKTLYHLSKILPWCQHFSSIPLDFCWHQSHFLPIWYSIMTSRYAFTVSIIFIFGCFDTALWFSVSLFENICFHCWCGNKCLL